MPPKLGRQDVGETYEELGGEGVAIPALRVAAGVHTKSADSSFCAPALGLGSDSLRVRTAAGS